MKTSFQINPSSLIVFCISLCVGMGCNRTGQAAPSDDERIISSDESSLSSDKSETKTVNTDIGAEPPDAGDYLDQLDMEAFLVVYEDSFQYGRVASVASDGASVMLAFVLPESPGEDPPLKGLIFDSMDQWESFRKALQDELRLGNFLDEDDNRNKHLIQRIAAAVHISLEKNLFARKVDVELFGERSIQKRASLDESFNASSYCLSCELESRSGGLLHETNMTIDIPYTVLDRLVSANRKTVILREWLKRNEQIVKTGTGPELEHQLRASLYSDETRKQFDQYRKTFDFESDSIDQYNSDAVGLKEDIASTRFDLHMADCRMLRTISPELSNQKLKIVQLVLRRDRLASRFPSRIDELELLDD